MHIYFSGIGGVGIGPLAMLALDAGYTVSGSDLQESEMTQMLTGRSAQVAISQDGTQVARAHEDQPIDWFVYSSALPEDHSELVFAHDNGIKTSKRADFLNQLIAEKNLQLIAVAGTHGKTTTTGMIVWTLKKLGVPVSYSIGTSVSFGPPAQYEDGSKYFIYECDEFDRNFLEFQPQKSIITSYDYDHPDTYPTPGDYAQAFMDFIEQSQASYLWDDIASELGLTASDSLKITEKNDPAIKRISLPGLHTKQNAYLAAQCIKDMLPETALDTIIDALDSFPGTTRRFEKLADNLYTDYAHHPAEIAATIQLAQEVNQNVVVIYQPHQNIRQHELLKNSGYKDVFGGAKKVYWLPTYLSREDKTLAVIQPEDLIATTGQADIEPAQLDDILWQHIQTHQQNGDLVIAMSAGDLDSWLREQVSNS